MMDDCHHHPYHRHRHHIQVLILVINSASMAMNSYFGHTASNDLATSEIKDVQQTCYYYEDQEAEADKALTHTLSVMLVIGL